MNSDQAGSHPSAARRLESFQHHYYIDRGQCDKGNAGDSSQNL
jgi:hypothetical protein